MILSVSYALVLMLKTDILVCIGGLLGALAISVTLA